MPITNVGLLNLAIQELWEVVPSARISAVKPCYDNSIVFETDSDIYYKWDFRSGCITQCHKGDWRK